MKSRLPITALALVAAAPAAAHPANALHVHAGYFDWLVFAAIFGGLAIWGCAAKFAAERTG